MADYKLKLDIDEKELARKIENAVRKGFGGTNGGKKADFIFGKDGSKQAEDISKIYQKIDKTVNVIYKTEEGTLKNKIAVVELERKHTREKIIGRLEVEKESRARQKMNRQMAGYNTLLRQATGTRGGNAGRNIGGLLGGRAGGAVGGAMDAIGPMFKLMKAKRALANADNPGGESGDFLKDAGNMNRRQRLGSMMSMAGKSKVGKAAGSLGKAAAMPVKVAGFMAGMAGAAGLGKMIIDSSPMLQAMLKLLNVGIMLILRPIGDFIGFMLRPLLLQFVKKVAIPAYREGAKFAKEWGTKMGKALLLLFTNPMEFLDKAIIQPIKAQWEKQAAGLDRWFRIIGILLNPFYTGNKDAAIQQIKDEESGTNSAIDAKYPGFGLGGTEMGQKLQDFQNTSHEDLFKVEKQIQDVKDKVDQVMTGGVVPAIDLGNDKLTSIDEQIKILVAQGMTQAEAARVALEQYQISNFGNAGANSYEESIAIGQKIFADLNQAKRDGWMKEQKDANDILGDIEDGINGVAPGSGGWGPGFTTETKHQGYSSTPGTTGPQTAFDNPVWAKFNNYRNNSGEFQNNGSQSSDGESYEVLGARSREEVEAYVEQMTAARLIGEAYHVDMNDFYVSYRASAAEVDTNMAAAKDSLAPIVCRAEAIKELMRISSDNFIIHIPSKAKAIHDAFDEAKKEIESMSSGGGGGSGGEGNVGTSPWDPNRSKPKANAMGGIINEPIFGLGKSGQTYTFGERGPETITPGVGTSIGGGSTYNVTINANNVTNPEQLKPLILRWLKESTSRVGIV